MDDYFFPDIYIGRQPNPVVTVECRLEELGLEADIFKLTIEHISGDQFSCRLGIERGDMTVGIHQRALTFELNGKNSVALVSAALALFADVADRED